MSDKERFQGLLDETREYLESLHFVPMSLEVSIDERESWIMYGAAELVNRDSMTPPYRLQNGDVQIKPGKRNVIVRAQLGRTLVEFVGRPA